MKKILSILIALALVLSFSVVGMPVAADTGTTYYVCAEEGDDGGDGTEANPWATIQHAINEADEGDTIIVAAGTYEENVVVNKEGLVLKGAQAGVDARGRNPEDLTDETVVSAPGGRAFIVEADGVTIDGFTFADSKHGILVPGGGGFSGTQVLNNMFLHNERTGMRFHNEGDPAEPALIQYNLFMETSGVPAGAIFIGDGDAVDAEADQANIVIDSNKFVDNEHSTINIAALTNSIDITVSNNVFEEGASGGLGAVIVIGDSDGVEISGNTFTETVGTPIYFVGGADNTEISGNLIDEGTGWAIIAWNWDWDSYLGLVNTNLAITGNTIRNFESGGIYLGPDTHDGTVTITGNQIYGNEDWGLLNDVNPLTVDATYNWWGDSTGPYHPDLNPLGLGDEVSDNVLIFPWIVDEFVVTPTPACEGEEAQYTVNFFITATALAGRDAFIFEFPEGTVLPEEWDTGDITVNWEDVHEDEIDVDGQKVTVVTPVTIEASKGDPASVLVVFTEDFGIVNPPAGDYVLLLSGEILCCPAGEPVESEEYTIMPAYSTYKFAVDFGAEYPGIALDFVPPFQYCEDTDFHVTLATDVEGCLGYDPVIVEFELIDAPFGGVATLELFDGTTWYEWELEIDPDDATAAEGFWGPEDGFEVEADYMATTPARIHFSIPGEYEICFSLEFLGIPDPCDPIAGTELAKRCIRAEVHQEMDAGSFEIGEKWNLISLPVIPFDNDIDSVLEQLNYFHPGQLGWLLTGDTPIFPPITFLQSVRNYDNLVDKWFFYSPWSGLPATHQQLSEMKDGTAYWIRTMTRYEFIQMYGPALTPDVAGLVYDLDGPAAGYTIWVFGTADPAAPSPPLAYEVAKGWTMMGFTSLDPMAAEDYLYPSEIGVGSVWNFGFILPAANMEPGLGYWVYFTEDGYVAPRVEKP